MQGRKVAFVGAISGLIVMGSGAVGFGLGRGVDALRTPAVKASETGTTMGAGSSPSVGSTPAAIEPAAGITVDRAIGTYPGIDFPGMPPYPGQAGTADGLHAVGVASKEAPGADAKPGQDLVEQAFDDAVEQAQVLAGAAGVKLGRLLSVSDVRQTQPWYKPCTTDPVAGVPEDTGSARDTPAILFAPTPCEPDYHMVAWVFVRYEIVP
ncbi:MAG: SIMPL domain-containing protein [Actinomycetota bacterium]